MTTEMACPLRSLQFSSNDRTKGNDRKLENFLNFFHTVHSQCMEYSTSTGGERFIGKQFQNAVATVPSRWHRRNKVTVTLFLWCYLDGTTKKQLQCHQHCNFFGTVLSTWYKTLEDGTAISLLWKNAQVERYRSVLACLKTIGVLPSLMLILISFDST